MILFLARSWHGTGGMQQLNHDLDAVMRAHYKEAWHVCIPKRKGGWWTALFLAQGFLQGIVVGWRSGQVHGSDASLAPLLVLIKFLTKARVGVTACGLEVIYPAWWYQWLMRHSLRHLDCVVCISNATAAEVQQRGVAPDNRIVIPCGVFDLHQVRPQPQNPHLLTIGRFVPRKGVVWFLENVFPLMRERIPSVHYTIAGSGPEERLIRESIHRLALEHAVTLLADVADNKRDDLLQQSSLFVMPNLKTLGTMEGFGIVCIEASVRGVPVVAAKLEGITDAVLEGKTGMFFESGDAHACADAVCAMLTNPLNPSMVRHTTLEHFAWATLALQYQQHVFQ